MFRDLLNVCKKCRKSTMKNDWQIELHNIKLCKVSAKDYLWKGGIYIKEKTAQQWIPIERFENDGFIKMKNGDIIKILK